LAAGDWAGQVARIEHGLARGLAPCRDIPYVAATRVLGAIGVVEMKRPVRMAEIQAAFVDQGVWVRPFGRLVYVMPPYVMGDGDLAYLTAALVKVVAGHRC
jgi:adenosylmethionine-8-amino-7-oxononanoate aminotransferase